MPNKLLDKSNTGISSEFLVAGELARRGFNVTMTFGNTKKALDLIVEKEVKRHFKPTKSGRDSLVYKYAKMLYFQDMWG